MKINFERIEIFTDMTKTKCVVQDVKKDFADVMLSHSKYSILKEKLNMMIVNVT